MSSKRRTHPKTTPWDAATYLTDARSIAGYLEAVLEDGDPRLIAAALGDIARAKGMTRVARGAKLGRESLYKALSKNGNPGLSTVIRVLRTLGVRLQPVPITRARSE